MEQFEEITENIDSKDDEILLDTPLRDTEAIIKRAEDYFKRQLTSLLLEDYKMKWKDNNHNFTEFYSESDCIKYCQEKLNWSDCWEWNLGIDYTSQFKFQLKILQEVSKVIQNAFTSDTISETRGKKE